MNANPAGLGGYLDHLVDRLRPGQPLLQRRRPARFEPEPPAAGWPAPQASEPGPTQPALVGEAWRESAHAPASGGPGEPMAMDRVTPSPTPMPPRLQPTPATTAIAGLQAEAPPPRPTPASSPPRARATAAGPAEQAVPAALAGSTMQIMRAPSTPSVRLDRSSLSLPSLQSRPAAKHLERLEPPAPARPRDTRTSAPMAPWQRPDAPPASPGAALATGRAASPTSQHGADTTAAREPPAVQVTIGRVEVHAAAAPSAPERSRRAAPRMSLEQYLQERNGGRR